MASGSGGRGGAGRMVPWNRLVAVCTGGPLSVTLMVKSYGPGEFNDQKTPPDAGSKLSPSVPGSFLLFNLKVLGPPEPPAVRKVVSMTRYVAGIRVDPGAPGLAHAIQREFGRAPQIRLIIQPVKTDADGTVREVFDTAGHLIFSFLRGLQPHAVKGCLPLLLPNDVAFRKIIAELVQIKQSLQVGTPASNKVDTSGPLNIHPGLADSISAQALKDRFETFLETHIVPSNPGVSLGAMAVMGLHKGRPEPWMFLAMQRLAPSVKTRDDVLKLDFLKPYSLTEEKGGEVDLIVKTRFRPVASPGVNGPGKNGNMAQMLFLPGPAADPKNVFPLPATNNGDTGANRPITCRFNQPSDKGNLLVKRQGVSTQELFTQTPPTTDRIEEVVNRIANPKLSHFFNTDCVSCHTETRRPLDLISDDDATKKTRFPHIATDVLPKERWNVRNFGWFTSFFENTVKATITQRTLTETEEVLDFINCKYLDGVKNKFTKVDGNPITADLCADVPKTKKRAAAPAAQPTNPKPDKVRWLNQGWSNQDRFWFHHATQGTSTLPIPYDWFVALQQPGLLDLSPAKLLGNPDYLRKFGFISSPRTLQTAAATLERFGYTPDTPSPAAASSGAAVPVATLPPERLRRRWSDNMDGLPVGFARTPGYRDPTTGKMLPDQIGFTCAACHTGELTYKGTALRFDGGAAMVDLDGFQKAMAKSLLLTTKLPIRFSLFADRILGADRNEAETEKLRDDVNRLVRKLLNAKLQQGAILLLRGEKHVVEGFGRLDALNRIGNQVFWTDLLPAGGKPGEPYFSLEADEERHTKLGFIVDRNFSRYSAPVSFPPIWTSPWNLWAQYDASILQPIIRNAGEALGVASRINLTNTNPGASALFHGSVDMRDLRNIEDQLAGPDPWKGATKGFKGLQAPRWSSAAKLFASDPKWQLDPVKVAKGRSLYAEICAECHLPPVRDRDYTKEAKPPANIRLTDLWDRETVTKCFNPPKQSKAKAVLVANGGPPKLWCEIDGRRYLMVTMKSATKDKMGTDIATAEVLGKRTIHLPAYLKINPANDLKAWKCGKLSGQQEALPFGPALMTLVERVTQQWFKENPGENTVQKRDALLGGRRNCPNTIPGPLYRARTLEGVWATAPFLHNGSVPSLWALLSPEPARDRPKQFCVGSKEFDPVKVGVKVGACNAGTGLGTSVPCACEPGTTLFDTTIPGNFNRGHEFTPDKKPDKVPKDGVVGRKLNLDLDERSSLIEYLKSL